MRVLITGGTGFIGSRLARRWREQGETVRVLAQANTPAERQNAEELARLGVELSIGSVTQPAAVARACQGADLVYHLAAAQHETNVPDRHYHDVNVAGTQGVLQAAFRAGVARLVHGSTIGVYGRDADGAVRDDSPLQPENIYGLTKLAAENLVRNFPRLPTVVVRISETYGPGDRRLLKLFRCIGRRRFFHVGAGRNLHQPVYIDDLLDGLQQAARVPALPAAPVVLAGPRTVTTEEMIAAISHAVGVPPPRLRVPLGPLQVAAVLMESVLRPCGIQPPLHRRRLDFFVKSFVFSQAPARDALGFRPQVGFAEGAVRTAAWYRDMKLLTVPVSSDAGLDAEIRISNHPRPKRPQAPIIP